MVAREAAHAGINWTFGPMVDLSRDPRWGRVIEGAGEDAFLGAAMAAARVRGYRKGGLAVAVKHYVGYGGAEAGRDYNDAPIPTSELFDRHLPPFKAAIDAGAETVMAAFNTVNGSPASADRRLLTDILRRRLGFNGFVTSDFDAIGNLMNHGVARDAAEAARRALLAGMDMDMVGEHFSRHLADELKSSRVKLAGDRRGGTPHPARKIYHGFVRTSRRCHRSAASRSGRSSCSRPRDRPTVVRSIKE